MDSPLVIFDCDGVLVDSEVIVARIEAEVLTSAGLPFSVGEILDRFVGISEASMMAAIAEQHGRPVPDEVVGDIRRLVRDGLADRLRPVPGIAEVLGGLSLARCVASSSALDRVRASLEVCGLEGYFDPGRIFSAQMVARGKPAPDLFLHAASACGADPESCVVIEDSTAGILAARSAGMTPIGFTAGGHIRAGHGERLADAGAVAVVETAAELGILLRRDPR